MDEPRAEKVAVVTEVRERLQGASAAVVTEYRGLKVGELAELRRSLTQAGSEYKIFKNTLVRRAVADSEHEGLTDLLAGPTALAFVHQDVSAVAKALRDFSRTHPALVVKGGFLEGKVLGPADLGALADLPSREVLLARVAGALAAPLQQLAGLVQALPRNLAYGLSALIEQGGVPEPTGDTQADSASDTQADSAGDTQADSAGDTRADSASDVQTDTETQTQAQTETQTDDSDSE